MIHIGLAPRFLFHLRRTVFAAFDQEVGSISLFLQYILNQISTINHLLFFITCVVIRFEQFVFEFLFVLETSQTIHSLKVDKITLIVLLKKWNYIYRIFCTELTAFMNHNSFQVKNEDILLFETQIIKNELNVTRKTSSSMVSSPGMMCVCTTSIMGSSSSISPLPPAITHGCRFTSFN